MQQTDEFQIPRLENIDELPALLASYENVIKITQYQTKQNEALRAMIENHCEHYDKAHKHDEEEAYGKINGLATNYSTDFKARVEEIQTQILEKLDKIQEGLDKTNGRFTRLVAIIGALVTGLGIAIGGLVKYLFSSVGAAGG